MTAGRDPGLGVRRDGILKDRARGLASSGAGAWAPLSLGPYLPARILKQLGPTEMATRGGSGCPARHSCS